MQESAPRKPFPLLMALLLLLGLSVAMACSGATDGTAEERLQRIYELDKADQVVVAIHDVSRDSEAYLFEDLPAGTQLDPSYEASLELCQGFDPAPRTRDDEKEDVGRRIDAFLNSIGFANLSERSIPKTFLTPLTSATNISPIAPDPIFSI